MPIVRRVPLRALFALILALAAPALAIALKQKDPAPVYVAIGDSLSAGVQPDAHGNNRATRHGYADQLASRLRPHDPGLSLVRFGGGGTTNTLIDGDAGRHHSPPALVQAERYLRAHRNRVVLISLNIGDNDVGACVSPTRIDERCASREIADVQHNLPRIVRRLRAAAGPSATIVGLADYDQFWAYWLRGPQGRAIARRSAQLIGRLNAVMLAAYRGEHAVAADAGPRFQIRAEHPLVGLRGHGRVPLAVQRVCLLTWACSAPPIGFNDHARTSGYALLADTMYRALRAAHALPPRTPAASAGGGAGP